MGKLRRIQWALALGLIFVVLIASMGTGILLLFQSLPHLAEQAEVQTREAPIIVQIESPSNNSRWPVFGPIPVQSRLSGSGSVLRQELYINGILWDVFEQTDSMMLSTGQQWVWTPNVTGLAVLQVRAVDVRGSTVVSNAVQIYLDDPIESQRYAAVDQGGSETAADLADKYQVPIEDILQANPTLQDPGDVAEGGFVLLPLKFNMGDFYKVVITPPTDPSISDDLLPGMELQDSLLNRLNMWVKDTLKADVEIPVQPSLTAAAQGCDVQLFITDHASNEDGFRVFRTQQGESSASLIATLAENPGQGTLEYQDSPVTGNVSYFISAFNSAGFSDSAPAFVAVDPVVCGNGSQVANSEGFNYAVELSPGLILTQAGIIQFQKSYDLAYLYVTLDGNNWERFPETGKYLPGGGEFDLKGYVESMINNTPDPMLDVEMEIWGWEGWQVIEIGKVKVHIARTVLQVCSQMGESACDINSDSGWATEINLPVNIITSEQYYADLKVLFKWDSAQTSPQHGFVWQVAHQPYPGPEVANTQGLIVSRGAYTPDEQSFGFNLNYLNDDGKGIKLPQWSSYGDDVSSNYFHEIYPPGIPFTLYVRVLPTLGGGEYGLTSNTVVLHYDTPPELVFKPGQALASELPNLFDVEFIEESYTEPVLVSNSQWGCVIYEQIVYLTPFFSLWNPPDDIAGCMDPSIPTCDCKSKLAMFYPGDKHCPASWSPPQGGGLWEDIKDLAGGIVNGFTSFISDLSQALEEIKAELAEQVAEIIPGCKSNPTCVNAVKSGLEAGFTALTGVPPHIPNFEELSEKGIAYAVEVAAAEIGADCDDTCKAILENGIQQAVNTGASQVVSPGCVSDAEAHNHLREKLCIYPGVKYHPAPGSVFQPATIKVRVTRRQNVDGEEDLTIADSSKYALWLNFSGTNDTRIGDWFPICGFKEGLNGENATGYTDAGGGYAVKRQINDPLAGALYRSKQVKLPWLSPGESIEIPLVLEQEVFWRENHGYDAANGNLDLQTIHAVCGDDWPYLYYEGKTHMQAAVLCLNAENKMVPCGAEDDFEIQNPAPPGY